jgi:hypothetical protein
MRPPNRTALAMVYDSARQRIVVFGGATAAGVLLGDTWEWDGLTWTEVATDGPAPRWFTRMAYDQERGRTVLFGGQLSNADTTPANDTWEWDGVAWTQQMPAQSPPPRWAHGMTYDVDRRRTLVFSGAVLAQSLSDTWEWDGATWSLRVVPIEPKGRYAFDMAYDPIHAQVVAFGGIQVFTALGDTLIYDFSSATAPLDQCVDGLDTDHDGLAGCSDPDCWGRCDPLCPPGSDVTCDPARPRCGDGTCSVLEGHLLCPSDCPAP